MDVLVPIKPDMNPAKAIRTGVGEKRNFVKLTKTANSTESPIQSDSVLASAHTSRNPPATVPGTRPTMAAPNPLSEMLCLCLSVSIMDRTKAIMVIGPGT